MIVGNAKVKADVYELRFKENGTRGRAFLVGRHAMGRHSDGTLFLATDFEKLVFGIIILSQQVKL